jgi:hypothetical protein
MKINAEFDKLKKMFIVDNGQLLSDDIFAILVGNKARISKDGITKHGGNFERLSKKKKEKVYEIMDKAWEFLEMKNNLFNTNDYFVLNQLGIEVNKAMQEKQ